jgi:hypothetical protein
LKMPPFCGVRRPHPSPPPQPIIPVRVTCYQSLQHQPSLTTSPFHILPFPLCTHHHPASTDIRDLPLSADCNRSPRFPGKTTTHTDRPAASDQPITSGHPNWSGLRMSYTYPHCVWPCPDPAKQAQGRHHGGNRSYLYTSLTGGGGLSGLVHVTILQPRCRILAPGCTICHTQNLMFTLSIVPFRTSSQLNSCMEYLLFQKGGHYLC